MKYRKMKAYLEAKQAWWDKLPNRVQESTTRPGRVKTR